MGGVGGEWAWRKGWGARRGRSGRHPPSPHFFLTPLPAPCARARRTRALLRLLDQVVPQEEEVEVPFPRHQGVAKLLGHGRQRGRRRPPSAARELGALAGLALHGGVEQRELRLAGPVVDVELHGDEPRPVAAREQGTQDPKVVRVDVARQEVKLHRHAVGLEHLDHVVPPKHMLVQVDVLVVVAVVQQQPGPAHRVQQPGVRPDPAAVVGRIEAQLHEVLGARAYRLPRARGAGGRKVGARGGGVGPGHRAAGGWATWKTARTM